MADRPDELAQWADGGTVTEPGGAKKTTGWVLAEKPPFDFMNWIQNLGFQWQQYLDTLLAGVATGGFFKNAVFGNAGALKGMDISAGSSPGLLSVSAGTMVTAEGVRFTLAADIIDFNSGSPVSPNAGPNIRIDLVYGEVDVNTKAITFKVVEGWTGGGPPPNLGIDALVAIIQADVNAGTYTIRYIFQFAHMGEPRGRLVYHSGPDGRGEVWGPAPLQNAIDTMNAIGGGVVEISGDDPGDQSIFGTVLMKSGVVIDGISQRSINQSQPSKADRLFNFVGATGATGTISGTGLITSANIDFNNFGLGSLVVISGVEYLIKEILASDECQLANMYYRPVATTPGGITFNMLINRAGLRNLTIRPARSADDATISVVRIDGTNDCFIKDCIIDYDYDGSGSGNPMDRAIHADSGQTSDNRNLTIENNIVRGDFAIDSISFVQGVGIWTNLIVRENRLEHSVIIAGGVTYTNGLYINNIVLGTETIDALMGWRGKFENEEHNINGTHGPAITVDDINPQSGNDINTTKDVNSSLIRKYENPNAGAGAATSLQLVANDVEVAATALNFLKQFFLFAQVGAKQVGIFYDINESAQNQVGLQVHDGATARLPISADDVGNAFAGRDNLAVGATDGFPYISKVAGKPTGTPLTLPAGYAPYRFDDTNNILWVYLNGAWRGLSYHPDADLFTTSRWAAGAQVPGATGTPSTALLGRDGNVGVAAGTNTFGVGRTGVGAYKITPPTGGLVRTDYVLTIMTREADRVYSIVNSAATWLLQFTDLSGTVQDADFEFFAHRVT